MLCLLFLLLYANKNFSKQLFCAIIFREYEILGVLGSYKRDIIRLRMIMKPW